MQYYYFLCLWLFFLLLHPHSVLHWLWKVHKLLQKILCVGCVTGLTVAIIGFDGKALQARMRKGVFKDGLEMVILTESVLSLASLVTLITPLDLDVRWQLPVSKSTTSVHRGCVSLEIPEWCRLSSSLSDEWAGILELLFSDITDCV